ncbi:MAG: YceD family protein [Bacteroidota bacterium]
MTGFYRIPLTGLKEGNHLYYFKIGGDFFSHFEKSEIHESELEAVVSLFKRPAHMEIGIKISGTVRLTCDRCLDLYTQDLNTDDSVLLKFGEQWEEVDDEVIIIPYDENEFVLDQLFYEFAHLGLPLKKVHPDDEYGNSTCNPEMLEKLEEHLVHGDEDHDPRWAELEKLKNTNN